MDMLFFLLSIACLVVLVIGLIKPAKVIKWGEEGKKTRKNVAKYYGIGFLVCFVLFGVNVGSADTSSTADKENKTNTTDTTNTANTENTTKNSTSTIQEVSDNDKAAEVDNLIAGLGDTNALTLGSSIKVGSARTAYNKLTENQKSLVTKLDALSAAENQIYMLAKAEEVDTKIMSLKAINLLTTSDTQSVADARNAYNLLSDSEKALVTKLDILKAAENQIYVLAKAAEIAAEKAKVGYNTGITYSQLARTPDNYKEEKVKFTGKVVQVMEGSGETQLRIAVNGDYDSILLVYYISSITSTRVLEYDNVTIKGVSKGLYTYKSTMGGEITIPLVGVDEITINN